MRRNSHTITRQWYRNLPLRLQSLETRDVPSIVPNSVVLSGSFSTPQASMLTPGQLRHAYGIDMVTFGAVTGNGTGQTIAIIDTYDNPHFVNSTDSGFNSSDLHKFDMQFGISDPPSFTKIDQKGGTNYPAGNTTWGTEIAVDVEWVHAMAPAANILLIEANTNSINDLTAGAGYASNWTAADVVSMSFSGPEFSGELNYDSAFVTPDDDFGITFLASTGYSSVGAGYPAYSPNVVAVGGTTLALNAGNYSSESGWSGSGGGVSTYEPKPAFQSATGISLSQRTIPDVAFDADPSSGVAVLDTFGQGAAAPWIQVGGTGLASTCWSGLIAIADQGRAIAGLSSLDGPSQTLPLLYSLANNATSYAADFHDVTTGNNGYAAKVNYDLVTGIGTPKVVSLLTELVKTSTVVTNVNDSGPGSLRQAVLTANSLASGQIVSFDSSVFSSSKTINLTSGAIPITDTLTISGPGSKRVLVSAGGLSRIFEIDKPGSSGNTITINGLDLSGGSVASDGGAIYDNDEALTMTDVIIKNCKATGSGGALSLQLAAASLSMSRCIIQNNYSAHAGGGIAINGNSFVTINNCTVSGNTAAFGGFFTGSAGGIYMHDHGTLHLTNTTISGNTSNYSGGGVYLNATTATIIGSTISENYAYFNGGGIYSSGANVLIENSTVAYNTAASGGGGGIYVAGGTVDVESSIVAKNTSGVAPDVDGSVTENFSLIMNVSGATISGANNQNALDPLLGMLSNSNGGFTATHAIPFNSPAINKGSNPTSAAYDQRGIGHPRVQQGQADIGAYELIPSEFIVTNTNDAGDGSLRQAAYDANASVGAQDITFNALTFFAPQTIKLTTGEIVLDDSVHVFGPPRPVTVSGNKSSRIFDLSVDLSATVSNMIFDSGVSADFGGAVRADFADVSFSNCLFTNNSAGIGGGAIDFGSGSLTLTDCSLVGNSAVSFAGAIAALGNLNIVRTSVIGNTAGRGGGIFASGDMMMESCTVSGNSAVGVGLVSGYGGSIALGSAFGNYAVIFHNCTVSGNSAQGYGGAVCETSANSATITVQNCTIVGNTAGVAGGGFDLNSQILSLESSIVSGNTSGTATDIVSAGTVGVRTSAIGSATGFTFTDNGGNLTFGAELNLAPLANNGGPTWTMLPLAGSPLINKGSNPLGTAYDQRGMGYPRLSNAIADIGAVEYTPTSFMVRNTNDAGVDSLRQAILDSNVSIGVQSIAFDPTVFATAQLINLASGQLNITDVVTIVGPGSGVLTVDGLNGIGQVFSINATGSGNAITISGLTITHGGAGGIYDEDEALTLSDVVVSNCVASTGGGILVNSAAGSLTMNGCTVTQNAATGPGLPDGGGIEIRGNSVLTLTNCTISNNTAKGTGGGIDFFSAGTLSLNYSTVSGNKTTAGDGGGIYLYGSTATVFNSTVSGNTAAGNGGGIGAKYCNLLVQNSTIAFNAATLSAGGIANGPSNLSTATITSTIVANNSAALNPDITGNVTENFSLILNTTGIGIITGGNNENGLNPLLGPLSTGNGGTTASHVLGSGSPAINKGSNPTSAAYDQRGAGYPRSLNTAPDIGAVESSTFIVRNTNNSGVDSLRQAVLDCNALTGTQTISFDPAVFNTAKTITLTSGEMQITDSLQVTGAKAPVTISGGGSSRAFNIGLSRRLSVTISSLTFTAGQATNGGAIGANNVTLVCNNCTFTNNSATNGGAVSVSVGSFTATDCTITGNSAAALGGAIFTTKTGVFGSSISTVLERTTVSGNSAPSGGGVYSSGYLLAENSTISGNSGQKGGGVFVTQSTGTVNVIVRNSTVSGNTVTITGGGVYDTNPAGSLIVQNATIAGNKAATGGGIVIVGAGPSLSIESSIDSSNTATTKGPDVVSANQVMVKTSAIGSAAGFTLTDLGGNLAIGTALNLGTLQNNGGPTFTRALLTGSPCINKGSNPFVLTADQRGTGFARVAGNVPDIGAYERPSAPQVASIVINDGSAQRSRVTSVTLSFDTLVTLPSSAANAFTLTRQSDNVAVNLIATVINNTVTTATFTFTGALTNFGSLADGRYTLTVLAAQISGGNFDGNGDGTAGDDYVLASAGTPNPPTNIFRLFGDANGDGTVSTNDFVFFRQSFNGVNDIFDFDGDGFVSTSDFAQFRNRFNTSI
jgi:Right handed beta helix region